jgi:hypothetical protein
LFSVVAGKGSSSEILGAAAKRQEAREELLATKEKDPSERTDSRRRSNTFLVTLPNPVDHVSRQRTRNDHPHRSRSPRPIADGL